MVVQSLSAVTCIGFTFCTREWVATATNVVVVVVVVVGTSCCCYQIFNSLKLYHFTTNRNETLATDW